jgi:hypothetical protein
MPSSNAERQRRYRQRHLVEGTDTRLNTVVSPHAKAALVRLAKHYAVTERAMLERLLTEAESELVQGFSTSKQKQYYSVTQ